MLELKLDGLVGVAVFLITIGLFALIALIALIFSVLKLEDSSVKISKQKAFKYFAASVCISIVDIFLFLAILPEDGAFTPSQGASLDWWMLFVWCPAQLISFLGVVWLFNFYRKNDLKVKEFIKKLNT